MQIAIVTLAALLCFAFGGFTLRKGLRTFRSGAVTLGSFIAFVSLQFLITPILILVSVWA